MTSADGIVRRRYANRLINAFRLDLSHECGTVFHFETKVVEDATAGRRLRVSTFAKRVCRAGKSTAGTLLRAPDLLPLCLDGSRFVGNVCALRKD